MSRLQQLQALWQESPTDSFLVFALAKEYEKLGDDHHALEFYQNLVAQDPQYVGTYYHLAKLQEKLEQTNEALETYAKGMQMARNLGDQHALAELSSAKMNLELEL